MMCDKIEGRRGERVCMIREASCMQTRVQCSLRAPLALPEKYEKAIYIELLLHYSCSIIAQQHIFIIRFIQVSSPSLTRD